jgi:hypothetical protein
MSAESQFGLLFGLLAMPTPLSPTLTTDMIWPTNSVLLRLNISSSDDGDAEILATVNNAKCKGKRFDK